MKLPKTTLALALLVATSGLASGQAPRATAESEVGKAKITIEHGCPPWNEQRRDQMERSIPIGGVWRLGADTRTTLVVAGAAVAFGDAVVETGGYGLNLRRTGEKSWAFVVYDGTDTNVLLEDAEWEAAATLTEKSDAAPERLSLAFADAGGRKSLVVRFGPMEIATPVAAIDTKEADLLLGGEQASARWFARAAADAPKPGAWTNAGIVSSFWVADVDCAMNVDLALDAAAARVRFVNRERAKVEGHLAKIERDLAAAKAGPAARFGNQAKELEEAKKNHVDELQALAANPAPVEVAVPLAAAKKASGRVGAQLVRRDKKLFLVVDANDRAGELELDEKKILPASAAKN